MTEPKIAVVGTGANGASIGADLTRAGHDVTFIEQWPAHVEAMRERGVQITSEDGVEVTQVNVKHLCEVATLREPFDLVYVVLKAYDTRWGTELIKPLVKPDGAVVGLQNGMSYADIESIVGAERALGAVIEVGSNMFEPGIVTRDTPRSRSWFAIGGTNPVAHAKAEQADAVLRAAGTVEVHDDILSAKWMKLVLNAAELVTSAILDLSIADAARMEGMRELMVEAGVEAMRAAPVLGHRLVPIIGMTEVDPERPEQFMNDMLDLLIAHFAVPTTKATVLQDWMKNRRSEVDQINGLVVSALAEIDDPAHVNSAAVELAHRIERGELEPGVGNFALFRELATS